MTDEQTAAAAAELYASIRFSSSHSANIAAIVRALQAARTPPPGHIIDDAGVVRRVKAYDTLDGRIWEEWHKRHEIEPMTLEQVHAAGLRLPDGFTDAADFIKHVRGQGEAAEAAKEGKA